MPYLRFAGLEFEEFLQNQAEEIIDHAVRDLIEEVDCLVFEEESSDVNVWCELIRTCLIVTDA